MNFERNLKIGMLVFGILHLFATYATLFIALASGMARFDGLPTSIPLFVEQALTFMGAMLLFPFGYLPIPFFGPLINSILWAMAIYFFISFLAKRRKQKSIASS
jgi:hypothetical protein